MTARSRRTSSCSMATLRYRNRIPGQYGNSFCDKVFRRCDGAHTWRVVRPAALAAWRRDRWAALSWAFPFSVQLWRPHPAVSPKGIKILRPDDDDRLVELTRTEETLRATAHQQEAVAHLGQQALAGRSEEHTSELQSR